MVRTNFSKVEEALNQGLLKFSIEHLFDLADEAATVGNPATTKAPSKKMIALKQQRAQLQELLSLEHELQRLYKYDKQIYSKMGTKQKEIEAYAKDPSQLKEGDWVKIRGIKEKIQAYRKAFHARLPKNFNKIVIQAERKKHINKRFNVNDKWLPLK